MSGMKFGLSKMPERIYVGCDDRFHSIFECIIRNLSRFFFTGRVWLIGKQISSRAGGSIEIFQARSDYFFSIKVW